MIHFTVDRVPRRMPLLLGFFLVSLFIWLAENIGSFSAVWLYPHQLRIMVARDVGQARLLVPADDHQLRAGVARQSRRAN